MSRNLCRTRGVTLALRRAGLHVLRPREAYPATGGYIVVDDLELAEVISELESLFASGSFYYVHFGVPCTRWGTLHASNGGTRRLALPQGDGSRADEVRANALVTSVARLCTVLVGVGSYFSIENPRASHILLFDQILALPGFYVYFDQCLYGLALPNASLKPAGERFKKPTRLLSNLSSLKSLEVKCDGLHKHTHIQGTIKVDGRRMRTSQFTGRYPLKLCEAWARAVASSCQSN